MIMLGVDPGYGRVGFAVIDATLGIGKERVLYSDCLTTDKGASFHERLFVVGKETHRILHAYPIDALAIELLFFSTNQKTALRVSEARGVIMYEALCRNIPVYEYTPLQIKNAIIGYGRGTKRQVDTMIRSLVSIQKPAMLDDEMDAIAVALTAIATEKTAH